MQSEAQSTREVQRGRASTLVWGSSMRYWDLHSDLKNGKDLESWEKDQGHNVGRNSKSKPKHPKDL